MQLYNTSQYAIRILNFIANHGDDRLYSAKELANILQIPYKFLTKIMRTLVQAELIESIQGREGGYRLKKLASKIKIQDILTIFHEENDAKDCVLGIGLCDSNNKCVLHDQWVQPRDLIRKMFDETSLADLTCKECKI